MSEKHYNGELPQTHCDKACYRSGFQKLEVMDWLQDVDAGEARQTDVVEVRFKNTRKGFYRNVNGLSLEQGDVVAVEASPGHDIGTVSLSGSLVLLQLKKMKIRPDSASIKKVYRKAKDTDIRKWEEAQAEEHKMLVKSREIAEQLKLKMKIGDVEAQGDKTKAIFYYIADERVDFRELIKLLAEELKIRIEMRQIGARQEAGMIGGTGPCGRELCCTTWLSNFSSVSTNAARVQDVSLNPQKLAGQCSKLKCCLNYELPVYKEITSEIPRHHQELQTEDGTLFHKKTDLLKRMMYYGYAKDNNANLIALSIEKVKEVVLMNKEGVKVKEVVTEKINEPREQNAYTDLLVDDDLNRFDHKAPPKKKKKRRKNNGKPGDKSVPGQHTPTSNNQYKSNRNRRNNKPRSDQK